MKAEINNENKEKFFAQYWGQDVLFDYPAKLGPYPINHSRNWEHEAHLLYLKPLSSISDEDAIELGYQICDDTLNANYGMSPSGCFLDEMDEFLSSDADYLRSKGYALPWMGLSVYEMIEAGWIKLVEN